MRIGFIAMSGVRVRNPELLKLGLTLPGFVERSKVIASLPSLGLLTLAGMTPREHEVVYLEVPDLRAVNDLPSGFDLVAISSFSAQILEAYELADDFRRAGVRVVMGGLHVTALPEEAALHADAVVVGEAELCWRDLLADAAAGRLKQYYRPPPGAFSLADAPMPAFELLDVSSYNRITVQTSRGCPHNCEFCASSILLTSRYKQKPMAKVLAEIDRICSIWPRPFIEFADDNSFVDRRYWKELLPQLAMRRIRWFTETDISVAEDEELLGLMYDSGCAQVLIGLESPRPSGLIGIELRNNWKFKKWPNYREAVRKIQAAGISVNGCFVLGMDDQTTDIFDQVYEFVEETALHEVQITIQTAFPGTPLYGRLKAAGRIIEDGRWDKCTLFDINFVPARMTVEELDEGFRKLMVRLYSPEFVDRRRGSFLRSMRRQYRERHAVCA
jgi:radical SAM superfamily enzyme YgiQ (UPF0313 family)